VVGQHGQLARRVAARGVGAELADRDLATERRLEGGCRPHRACTSCTPERSICHQPRLLLLSWTLGGGSPSRTVRELRPLLRKSCRWAKVVDSSVKRSSSFQFTRGPKFQPWPHQRLSPSLSRR
jgi:hypothetical protein